MFNPDFRYLLVQEEHNGEMIEMAEKHLFAAILVCTINVLTFGVIVRLAYELCSYFGLIIKFIWSTLWVSLSPGNQLFELAAIVTSIVVAVMMFMVFEGISDLLNKSFDKLKDEIKKKDEKIKELEAKIKEAEELVKNK
jgi:hypothetical protein